MIKIYKLVPVIYYVIFVHDWQHKVIYTSTTQEMQYTMLTAMMSLGDRNFSAPLESYGTTIIHAAHCQLKYMWHMSVYDMCLYI
jgi:hypothetical protein